MYVSCISICFFSFYFSEGFVHLESIVGEAIIRLMANPNMTDCDGYLEDITVSMRQLPYPQYTVDIFLSIIVNILPLFVVLAYIYSAGIFTKVQCMHCTCTTVTHNYILLSHYCEVTPLHRRLEWHL